VVTSDGSSGPHRMSPIFRPQPAGRLKRVIRTEPMTLSTALECGDEAQRFKRGAKYLSGFLRRDFSQ
jgi:hypothetical protein